MNKAQLAAQAAKATGLSRIAAENVINAIVRAMHEALDAGDTVRIVNLGLFKRKTRKAKDVRLPSGKTVQAPEKTTTILMASKNF